MSEQVRMEVTRTVEVSAAKLFEVLRTPARHVELDDSNMLRGQESGVERIRKLDDEFIMNMNNQLLGDYQIKNTVVVFEKDLAIGWAPMLHPEGGYTDKLGDTQPGGHTYTWHLFPQESGGTRVTQVYEWSGVKDPQFRSLFPLLTEEQLGASIERAAQAAAEG